MPTFMFQNKDKLQMWAQLQINRDGQALTDVFDVCSHRWDRHREGAQFSDRR